MALHELYLMREGKGIVGVYKERKSPNIKGGDWMEYDDEVWDVPFEKLPSSFRITSNDTTDLVDLRVHKHNDDPLFQYFTKYTLGYNKLLFNRKISLSSEVKDLNNLFGYCGKLLRFTKRDFPNLDLDDIYSLNWTFSSCKKLREVDLSGFKFYGLKRMCGTFQGCPELVRVNLSNINFTDVLTRDLFYSKSNGMMCQSLTELILEDYYEGCYACHCIIASDFIKNYIAAIKANKMISRRATIVVPEREVNAVEYEVEKEFEEKIPKGYKVVVTCREDLQKRLNMDQIDLVSRIQYLYSGDFDAMASLDSIDSAVFDALKSDINRYSTESIIDALQFAGISNRITDSYYSKNILPLLEKYLPGDGSQSSYSIGDVAKMLYKKFPESLVNRSIVRFLSDQYVV